MHDQLNVALALVGQAFDELCSIIDISEIGKIEFNSSPNSGRITSLINTLNSSISRIDKILSDFVSDSSTPPFLSLPAAHRKIFYDIVEKYRDVIQRLHLRSIGLEELMDFFEDSGESEPCTYKRSALFYALDRWIPFDDDVFEWKRDLHDRGIDIDGAMEIVEAPWFEPDKWSQNLRQLRPVLIDRKADVMRNLARDRLTEVYRSFTFGLWLATIALSRSLVEFSIFSNGPRLGIETTYINQSGRKLDRSLWELQGEIVGKIPELAASLEIVRNSGNRIMHPKKNDVVSHPYVQRREALECVLATKEIVETLYSHLE